MALLAGSKPGKWTLVNAMQLILKGDAGPTSAGASGQPWWQREAVLWSGWNASLALSSLDFSQAHYAYPAFASGAFRFARGDAMSTNLRAYLHHGSSR
jgi:hypothetical protein